MGDFLEWAITRADGRCERRPHPRKRVVYPGLVVFDLGQALFSCTIRDISPSGARIAFGRVPLFPDDVHLIDIAGRLAHDARVIWCAGYQAGLSFRRSMRIENIVEPSLTFLKALWSERLAG